MTVYSYAPLTGLPAGASTGDAASIVPEASMGRFIYGAQPNLSHFTDYFRYNLFLKTDKIWLDTDMLMMRWSHNELNGTILAREHAESICGAIMRIESSNEKLPILCKACEGLMDRELRWGETGPLLLTKVFGQAALSGLTQAPRQFYEIDHSEFWKALLPRYADECASRTEKSFGVHLWNNIIDTLGYWKWIAPPERSFLSHTLKERGLLHGFKDTYPERIMESMVNNYILRKSGGDLGVKGVTRQLLPSIGRSIRHYRK